MPTRPHLCRVLPLPQPKKKDAYSVGYQDGLRDGERWASERMFWLGIGAGLLATGVIALAVVLIVQW